jgi:hypothetical protein
MFFAYECTIWHNESSNPVSVPYGKLKVQIRGIDLTSDAKKICKMRQNLRKWLTEGKKNWLST